jgi:hypothetical protein
VNAVTQNANANARWFQETLEKLAFRNLPHADEGKKCPRKACRNETKCNAPPPPPSPPQGVNCDVVLLVHESYDRLELVSDFKHVFCVSKTMMMVKPPSCFLCVLNFM